MSQQQLNDSFLASIMCGIAIGIVALMVLVRCCARRCLDGLDDRELRHTAYKAQRRLRVKDEAEEGEVQIIIVQSPTAQPPAYIEKA